MHLLMLHSEAGAVYLLSGVIVAGATSRLTLTFILPNCLFEDGKLFLVVEYAAK